MTILYIIPWVILGIACLLFFIIGRSLVKRINKQEDLWNTERKKLRDKIHELEIDSARSEGCENRIVELNNRIEEKQDFIKSIDEEIEAKKGILSYVIMEWKYLDDLRKDYSAKLEKIQSERDLTADELKSLSEGLEDAKTAIQEFSRNIENLKKEIKDLQEQKRLALLYLEDDKEGLWELILNNKEIELLKILNEIKSNYKELESDIASIEWKKIWLPKLQDLCNSKELDRKGIYRLILKEDDRVCYVGQAQSIKDRWYQHVKKMIGVDSKGNEKLYDGYSPDDFYWTVVEFDCKDLNEREHYWIEYWGCKEIGLNKKA